MCITHLSGLSNLSAHCPLWRATDAGSWLKRVQSGPPPGCCLGHPTFADIQIDLLSSRSAGHLSGQSRAFRITTRLRGAQRQPSVPAREPPSARQGAPVTHSSPANTGTPQRARCRPASRRGRAGSLGDRFDISDAERVHLAVHLDVSRRHGVHPDPCRRTPAERARQHLRARLDVQ